MDRGPRIRVAEYVARATEGYGYNKKNKKSRERNAVRRRSLPYGT